MKKIISILIRDWHVYLILCLFLSCCLSAPLVSIISKESFEIDYIRFLDDCHKAIISIFLFFIGTIILPKYYEVGKDKKNFNKFLTKYYAVLLNKYLREIPLDSISIIKEELKSFNMTKFIEDFNLNITQASNSFEFIDSRYLLKNELINRFFFLKAKELIKKYDAINNFKSQDEGKKYRFFKKEMDAFSKENRYSLEMITSNFEKYKKVMKNFIPLYDSLNPYSKNSFSITDRWVEEYEIKFNQDTT